MKQWLQRLRVFRRLRETEKIAKTLEDNLSFCPECGVVLLAKHPKVQRHPGGDGKDICLCKWDVKHFKQRKRFEEIQRKRKGV